MQAFATREWTVYGRAEPGQGHPQAPTGTAVAQSTLQTEGCHRQRRFEATGCSQFTTRWRGGWGRSYEETLVLWCVFIAAWNKSQVVFRDNSSSSMYSHKYSGDCLRCILLLLHGRPWLGTCEWAAISGRFYRQAT